MDIITRLKRIGYKVERRDMAAKTWWLTYPFDDLGHTRQARVDALRVLGLTEDGDRDLYRGKGFVLEFDERCVTVGKVAVPKRKRRNRRTSRKSRKVADYGRPKTFRRGVSRRLEIHDTPRGHCLALLFFDEQGKPQGVNLLNDGPLFTVFTKDEHCGRGEYAEEIDIILGRNYVSRRRSRAAVRNIAKVILAAEYDEGLRVSRIVERFGMF